MAIDFQPLHNETHKDIKVGVGQDVSDLKNQHALGIVVQEFSRAGAEFPIVFVQDSKNKRMFPIVMLGLEQNTNLFVNEANRWDAGYMPARYTHKPFTAIAHEEDENRYAIAIDVNSDLITEDGDALFGEDGKETEYLAARKKAMMTYIENEQMTNAFIKHLTDLDLIQSKNLKVTVNNQDINLNGLFMVDEKKLAELPEDKFLDLRNRGFLGPIYSHLSSIHQVNRLLERKAKLMLAEQ